MQAVRTIVWVLVLVALLAFSFLNWRAVEVMIWPGLILETKVPALVVVSFLLGLIPTWLVHRGIKWQLDRRISSLENAARANAMGAPGYAASGPGAAAEPGPEPVVPVEPVEPSPIAPEGPPRP
ncbi:hypothetical protein J4558_13895 [Leptolyngbya sp. 15MV]|nr:hypothetical protein J4558_13895 [Leptolyngbya sp. 15MV]